MKTLLTTLFCLFISANILAQRSTHPVLNSADKPNKPEARFVSLNKDNRFSNADVSGNLPTQGEKELYNKIRDARKSNDRDAIQRLNSELNRINGIYSKRCSNSDRFAKGRFDNLINDDAVSSPMLYFDNIMSIATATEQRGSNTGRIWTIVASNVYGPPDYSYLDFFYSDDKGVNWTSYAYTYNPYEINVEDAIDAEILEDNTGTKYLYVVTGTQTVSTGKYICLLTTLNISGNVTGVVERLEWPGFDYNSTDVNYFKPRITTDNAFWTGAAYVYIAAGQDSLNGAAYDFCEKAAMITDPFNPLPAIDYKPYAFFYYSFGDPFYQGTCDIAWYDDPNNGGGSVILSESGAFFTTAIYLYETADVGFISSSFYLGYLDPDGIDKSFAYISSNGLYGNLMIVNVSEYSPTDNDIQYFSTTNSGVNWTTGFISYTFDDDERADITGLRNVPGNFYSCHTEEDLSFDIVFHSVARNNVWEPMVSPMNVFDASYFADPRPGIKLGDMDSCFVVWSQYYNSNVWATSGCDLLEQSKTFSFRLFIEGFYLTNSYQMNRSDTVVVKFRNAFSPYNVVESGKATVFQSGYAARNFKQISNTTNYYITINHRNTIETWSASPVNFGGFYNLNYDFVATDASAYGSNEKYLGYDGLNYYYGIFSGDVNQEGSIDLSDIILIFNDANNFVSGYVVTDLTGDDFVDLSDITVAYNNSINFVSVIRP